MGATTILLVTTLFFLVVVTPEFILSANAQTCEKYKNGTAFGYCDKWVNYDYYLPATPTKWIGLTLFVLTSFFFTSSHQHNHHLLGEALAYNGAYILTTSATIFGKGCAGKLQPLLCSIIFPPCHIDSKTGVATPQPTCTTLCDETEDTCEDDLTGFWQPLNCTALGTSDDKEQCYMPNNTSAEGPGYPFECGKDLVNYEGVCVLRCPRPIVKGGGEKLYEVCRWFLRILLPPGCIALGIMLLISLYGWRYWLTWPKIYLFHILLSTFLYDFAFLMGVFVGGQDELVCNDQQVLDPVKTPVAVAQAWFNYPWSMVLNGAFPALSFSLLLTFTYPGWTRKYYRYINVLLHAVIYGLPFTAIIVCQSLGLTGACEGNFPCQIEDRTVGSLEFGVNFFIQVLPITIYFVLGWLVCVPLMFYRVYRISGWKGISKQKRLLFFTLCYGLTTPLNTTIIWEVNLGFSLTDAFNYYAAVFYNKFQDQLYWHATPPAPYPLEESDYFHVDPFIFFWSSAFVPIYLSYVYIFFFMGEAYHAAFKRSGTTKSTGLSLTKSSKRSRTSSQRSQVKGTSVTHSTNSNNSDAASIQ